MSHRIIGADWCPYCVKVKQYFDSKKLSYEWVDSDTPEGEKIRNQESAKFNFKTIPMVFINGKFIGGCDNFFEKNGKEFKL
jgi:glutaredoxin 3